MGRTPNETVYDDQIAPLMSQIIAICEKHKIGCVLNFHLGADPTNDDLPLFVTTAMLGGEYESHDNQMKGLNAILGKNTLESFAMSVLMSEPSNN